MDRIAQMLEKLIDRAAKEKIKLAPFIGIGCPGLIDEHGTIVKGGPCPGTGRARRSISPPR